MPGTAMWCGGIKPRSPHPGQGVKTGRTRVGYHRAPVSDNTQDDPKPWRVIASRYLHNEPPWLVVREDRVALPSGVEIDRYWVNEYEPWCNVIAVTPAGEIVLIRQYRHGIGSVAYELPGGVADHGTLEESARAELRQETGYGGGTWTPFITMCANPSLSNNWTHTFLAEGVERLGDAALEATEDLRTHLVPAGDIVALIDTGDIIQALHAAALLRYCIGRARAT